MMKPALTSTALLAAISLTTPLATQAGLINFEGFAAGTIISDQYLGSDGVTIYGHNIDHYGPSSSGENNMAVIFDTEDYTGGDRDLASPFSSNYGQGVSRPGNVLIIHEHPGECGDFTTSCGNDPDDEGSRPAGYFEITFEQAVTLNSIDFFDVETVENGTRPENLIQLFDGDSIEFHIEEFYTPNTGGDNLWRRIDYGLDDISSIRIFMGGSGAIDNISFSVTEPSSLLLLGIGLAGLGWCRRKAR